MVKQLVRKREVNDLVLLFYSHDELIVKSRYSSVIFHCWFIDSTKRRQTFRPFRKTLMHRKDITLSYCYEQAHKFGVLNIADRHGKATQLLAMIDKELPSEGEARNAKW